MGWAAVQVHVLLDRLALGAGADLGLSAAVGSATLVKGFSNDTGNPVSSDFDWWGKSIQHHGKDQGGCNHNVPLFSQIGEGTILNKGNP